MTSERVAILVGAAIACVCVAFLAWSPAPVPEARPEAAALTTAARVDARGDELADRVVELERRLAAAEQRLAESKEQVLQLQLFVQRLEVTPAAPIGTPGPAPSASSGQPGSGYPGRPVLVQAGDDEAAVRARHGAPGEVEAHKDGGRTLHYWQEGLFVEVDAGGRVKEAVYLGVPRGTQLDANGNTGVFSEDGRWYRPSRWSAHGIEVGDSGVDLVARLGSPDSATPDADGKHALHYARLDTVFFLTPEPDLRVFMIRVGGGPAQADANGNVR